MLELKHLKTLTTLAKTGSLQAAALELCVTQSALSHQLGQLEQRLGQRLFQRKSQPLQFTASGQALLDLAQRVLPDVAHTLRQLQQPGDANATLVLSVECHACFHWILPALRLYRQQYPALTITLSHEIEHDAVSSLLTGELDIVLTTDLRHADKLQVYPLFELELVLLVSPDHPLAQAEQITPALLQHEVILSYPIPAERQDLFRCFMPDLSFKGQLKAVAQGSQIVQLVAAGQGIAALPRWMAEPFASQGLLVSKTLGTAGLWRPMYLLHRPHQAPASALAALAEVFRQAAPESTRPVQLPK